MKRNLFLLLIALFVIWQPMVGQTRFNRIERTPAARPALQYDTVRVGDQWATLERNPHYKTMNVRMVEDIKHDTISSWKRRISVQSNVIDWGLTIPNLTVGIDLGDPFVRTTPQLLVGMRNTLGGHRWYNQENSWDLQSVKVELRRHYLTRKWRKELSVNEPPKAPGRMYGGLYGEFAWKMHFDGHNTGLEIPYGRAYAAGLTWGYELPKRNYNHRILMNWDFGVDVGVVYWENKDPHLLPLVTDLRVALNFRHDRMNFLYWKPNEKQYERNRRSNNELRLRLEQVRQRLDSLGRMDFYVTSVSGDSAFREVITEEQVIREIGNRLGMKGLKQGEVAHYETSTRFPIEGKALGEYYTLDYRFGMRPESKLEEQYGTDTLAFSFPFTVRLQGYEEADSMLVRFERNVAKWRAEHGGNYPTLRMKHLDREHVAGHATMAQIIDLFKEVGGVEFSPEQIQGYYYKSDELRPVAVEEINLRAKRNTYYSVALRLHPQVMLEGGAMASRFVLDFSDAPEMQSEYAMLARYFNSGRSLTIERVWTGNDQSLEPVTAEEIVETIARDTHDSINFLRPGMIIVDSITTLGNHRFSVQYDAMFQTISDRRITVSDSLGRNNAQRIHHAINDQNYIGYYRDYDYVGYPTIHTDDPGDATLITAEMVAECMSRYYGVTIEPYQVVMPVYSDSNNAPVYTQAWPNHPAVYRGMALIRLHPEYPTNIKFYYKVVR